MIFFLNNGDVICLAFIMVDTRNPSPEIITINSLVAQWCQWLRQGQQRRTEEEISVRVDNQRHQTSSCYFVSYTDCDYLSSLSLCPTFLPIPFILQTFITCPLSSVLQSVVANCFCLIFSCIEQLIYLQYLVTLSVSQYVCMSPFLC